MKGLWDIYIAQFRTQVAVNLQYRVENLYAGPQDDEVRHLNGVGELHDELHIHVRLQESTLNLPDGIIYQSLIDLIRRRDLLQSIAQRSA